jgi:acyl-coenzyme A synthetase/AMP-(fatty) acid ligase
MSWLIDNFNHLDDKIAIIHKSTTYTYKELFNNIEKVKKEVIKNKINPGEAVSIIDDYSFDSISLLLALYQNKNIIVPITSKIEVEVNNKIKESFSTKSILLYENKIKVNNHEINELHQMITTLQNRNCSGLIFFSSGSTGNPKAMIHNFDNLVDHYKNKKQRSINMILFLMFDHIGGLNTLLNILSTGATMIIPENRNADDICRLIQDYKIKILPSSPTFLNLILMNNSYDKYDLTSLRMITYGTETMPESLLKRLRKIFSKVKFLQTFGTSETGIANTSSKSSNSTFMKIDDINLEYKIVENELWLKSKTQVLGYLNSSMNSFTDDGWFKTGDLVEEADDGYIKIIGRNKEVINVGGEKVLPSEIESIILSILEIQDVLVYGEKNIITGQTVVCDVVIKNKIESGQIKKIIRKYCRDKLAIYKIPTKVNIVTETNFGERFKKFRIKQ